MTSNLATSVPSRCARLRATRARTSPPPACVETDDPRCVRKKSSRRPLDGRDRRVCGRPCPRPASNAKRQPTQRDPDDRWSLRRQLAGRGSVIAHRFGIGRRLNPQPNRVLPRPHVVRQHSTRRIRSGRRAAPMTPDLPDVTWRRVWRLTLLAVVSAALLSCLLHVTVDDRGGSREGEEVALLRDRRGTRTIAL